MSLGFDGMSAVYFEGDRPIAEEVSLHLVLGVLHIGLDDNRILHWPVADVRQVPDTAGSTGVILRLKGDPLARLFVTVPEILPHLPNRARAAPPRGRGRLAAWAVAAVAAVGLQIGYLVPLLADNMAFYIPPAGERALGEATFGHIREALDQTGLNPVPVCEAPEGAAVLERLAGNLGAGPDLRQQISVSVLDHEMINAFALPGGFVVLFRGLIDAAEGPDEVAAVLAHEIGHVISRDPTRHALRSAGSIGVLGLLLGDFAGGAAVLFLAEKLIAAQYSQGAETDADRFAHTALGKARVSPAALGMMFENMRDKHGDREGVTAHFLSHPSLGKRIDAATAAVDPDVAYTPSMGDADWDALQNICR